MATISVAGYTWRQRQSEAEWRLHPCFEFSGRHLTDSVNPAIPSAYKKASPDKQRAYTKCVEIAYEIWDMADPVVVSNNTFMFTVGFYTIDPVNGNINRVYWITSGGKYYADV